ncbi:hypothetical protein MUY35_00920 [Aliiroseovarius sp. S1339]|uniref:hypothetical protein n=1 Tax=Aliiroseovarius sp. S1339 TaxID=2936990 RepID=UPI0020BE1A2D|nr:hypothetical protein [Aliiroseovarius sp. S1339]MCK8462407.1 hypothetical protein [Aliiroseovarius sp. S1339]
MELALASEFGNRLSEITVKGLCADLRQNPSVFHFIVTGDTTEVDPSDRAQWASIARRAVENDEISQLNLASNDRQLRARLTAEFMESVKKVTLLQWDRDGSLADRVEDYVQKKISEYARR